LEEVPDGEDLYFISDDADYFSLLVQGTLDPYLAEEWKVRKESAIHPHDRISSLFRDHFPNIRLASELEKDLLIQQLASSSSFSNTHNIISKLSRYSQFTPPQVNEIVVAAISNDQIYWIARDSDVHKFLSSIVRGREDLINTENLPRIRYVIDAIEPCGEIPPNLGDTGFIPF
jgi:hypothetical protein